VRWTAERRVDGCHDVEIVQVRRNFERPNDTGIYNLPRDARLDGHHNI